MLSSSRLRTTNLYLYRFNQHASFAPCLRSQAAPLPRPNFARGLIVASDVPQRADSGKGEEGVSALDACVRHVWRSTGYADPSAALLAASAHPAALLGLRNKGSLAPGADADLVLLDGELQVLGCYVGGLLAWEHPKMHGAYWWHR